MCGIIGYIGPKDNLELGMNSLKRLEYRGYDSAGMAIIEEGKISSERVAGKVNELREKLKERDSEGTPCLFHSRWATHGKPTKENAHPQFDCKREVAVVHNGIIENHKELKEMLEKEGHEFSSETDTETIAHLVEKFQGEGSSLEDAVRKTMELIRGAYGIAVISTKDPEKIVAARMSSPVIVSSNKEGGFVASDPAAIVEHSSKMIFLEDGELAVIKRGGVEVTDMAKRKKEKEEVRIDWDIKEAQKSGYPHFMIKEIMEQPETIENTLRGRIIKEDGDVKLGGLEQVREELKGVEKLTLLACGTSYYASMIGKFLIEEIAGIPTEVDLASEFRYRKRPYGRREAFAFISQSGETADTLKALEEVNNKGALSLGIVNVVGSSISRYTDAGIYNHAGPEIGVASTKAFTSQLAVLTLFSVFLGRQRNLSLNEGREILEKLESLPSKVREVLEKKDEIKEVAKKYGEYENFLFMGRRYNFPTALEGALKLKEISYIHAEGYSAAEMKHGAIALIDESFPAFAIALSDSMREKMVSNIEEIRARSGPVIILGTEGDEGIKEYGEDSILIPEVTEPLSPLLSVVPLQLFAYYVAVSKGFDPDKPRNLSKVVTVE